MGNQVVLHSIAGPPGSTLERALAGAHWFARLRPNVAALDRMVTRVTAAHELVARAGSGLPAGMARPEAIAVRLRRAGYELVWGEPQIVPDLRSALAVASARGRSSIDVLRADPSLASELQAGAWFSAGWPERAARRAAMLTPDVAREPIASPLAARLLLDAAFWRGVRSQAGAAEWRRLARSSYVVLLYHRLAGDCKPGQDRLDTDPSVFRRQVDALRRLRFTQLAIRDLMEFHAGERHTLSGRSFAVSFDDGTLDCAEPLETDVRRWGRGTVQLFVPTREVGGVAHWLDGEPMMGWGDVDRLERAGVAIGSHGAGHVRLPALDDDDLDGSLRGSRDELRARLHEPLDMIAYPNGAHDARVRTAAVSAGYRLGFTTEKGRNGAGVDPLCLRRVSVHAGDGVAAVVWKALTGEGLPWPWLRARALRRRLAGTSPQPVRSASRRARSSSV